MTNSVDLIKFVKKNLDDKPFVVATQKEPYVHIKKGNKIKIKKSAGGVHILLDGILRQTGGLMVAIGGGDADKLVVDKENKIKVPPGEDSYTLKRVFLNKKEYNGFYYGFANQTLWPLSHAVFVKPIFNPKWWDDYVTANKKYADAILKELKGKEAFIWVNDYHLCLVPMFLKQKNPKLSIGTFWHIPWPTYEVFRINPWRKEIIKGLLGSDFIGFHRGYHVENFIECVRREIEVIIGSEPRSIQFKKHITKLANLPAGIDYNEIKEEQNQNKIINQEAIKKDLNIDYKYLIIGVDRIDYTKGIPERLKIIDKLLEKYPKFQKKLVYVSIGAPSRVVIPAYKKINDEINYLVKRINKKYSKGNWKPIHFINKIVSREKIYTYYQLADVCMVTSLDDGMNLVAKEYVICNKPDKGMLLLSKFTGAAKDLQSAFLINPYDTEGSAGALYEALSMSPKEKVKRNEEMKQSVKENNIYKWAVDFIDNTINK